MCEKIWALAWFCWFCCLTVRVCSFTSLFIHGFVHSWVCSFMNLFMHEFVHSWTCSFMNLFIHELVHSWLCSFMHLCIHERVHSWSCSSRVSSCMSLSTHWCVCSWSLFMYLCTHGFHASFFPCSCVQICFLFEAQFDANLLCWIRPGVYHVGSGLLLLKFGHVHNHFFSWRSNVAALQTMEVYAQLWS